MSISATESHSPSHEPILTDLDLAQPAGELVLSPHEHRVEPGPTDGEEPAAHTGTDDSAKSHLIKTAEVALAPLTAILENLKEIATNFHGEYCGPGSKPSAPDAAPTDALDKACKDHDHAYGKKYFDLEADLKLIDFAWGRIFAPDASWEERAKAAAVVTAFTLTATFFSGPKAIWGWLNGGKADPAAVVAQSRPTFRR
jgi:hypothetical protein